MGGTTLAGQADRPGAVLGPPVAGPLPDGDDDRSEPPGTGSGTGVLAADLAPRRIRLIFFGLMLALLLAALDQMIVATALPKIVGELHGLDSMSWALTAYLLASTIGLPIYGKLGDLFGRKSVFQFAVVAFVLKLPKPTAKPRLDVLGALLLTAGSTCPVLLTSWGGTTYAWGSEVIVGLGAGRPIRGRPGAW